MRLWTDAQKNDFFTLVTWRYTLTVQKRIPAALFLDEPLKTARCCPLSMVILLPVEPPSWMCASTNHRRFPQISESKDSELRWPWCSHVGGFTVPDCRRFVVKFTFLEKPLWASLNMRCAATHTAARPRHVLALTSTHPAQGSKSHREIPPDVGHSASSRATLVFPLQPSLRLF
jgi:hypothetical protein